MIRRPFCRRTVRRSGGVEGWRVLDAVAANVANLFDEKTLCDLIRDVVQSVKKNLKVDWTKPHREDVKAGVRAAVKTVLRKRGVKKELLDTLTDKVIVQAEAMFKDWPLAA